jgi:hypothetical protein
MICKIPNRVLKFFGPLKFQNHGVGIESYRKRGLWATQITLYLLAGQDFAGCLPKSAIGLDSTLLHNTSANRNPTARGSLTEKWQWKGRGIITSHPLQLILRRVVDSS